MTQEQIDRVNRKVAAYPVTIVGETIVDKMIEQFGEKAVIDALCKSNVYVNRRLRPWEVSASSRRLLERISSTK